MRHSSLALILIILSVTAIPSKAQTYDQLDKYLEKMVEQKKFIGNVLLAEGDEVVYHKAHGPADVDRLNTTDSQFLIGSITKTFTAVAIMQLAEQGKLSLDDSLSTYLALFPKSETITIEHLLKHKSGIKSYTDLAEMNEWKYNKLSPIAIIEKVMDSPLEFEPGTSYAYSNSNYIILGLIIEQVSGVSYQEYIATKVLPKANMTHTGMKYGEATYLSQGLSPSEEGWQVEPKVDPSVPYAAGALYSRCLDMLRFSNTFFEGGFFENPVTLNAMINFDDGFYGLGIYTETLGEETFIGHNGGIDGFSSSWKYFPGKNLHMIVLSNSFFSKIEEVSAAALTAYKGEDIKLPEDKKAVDLSVDQMRKFEGKYELQRGFMIDVFLRGESLFARATGQNEFELYPESDTSFFAMVTAIDIDFRVNDKQKVQGLTLFQGGGEFFAPKIDEEKKVVDLDLADLTAVTGSYELQPGLFLEIFLEDGYLFGQASGQESFELFPESRTSFFTIGQGIEIEFQFDDNGDAESLILFQGGGAYEAKLVSP